MSNIQWPSQMRVIGDDIKQPQKYGEQQVKPASKANMDQRRSDPWNSSDIWDAGFSSQQKKETGHPWSCHHSEILNSLFLPLQILGTRTRWRSLKYSLHYTQRQIKALWAVATTVCCGLPMHEEDIWCTRKCLCLGYSSSIWALKLPLEKNNGKLILQMSTITVGMHMFDSLFRQTSTSSSLQHDASFSFLWVPVHRCWKCLPTVTRWLWPNGSQERKLLSTSWSTGETLSQIQCR